MVESLEILRAYLAGVRVFTGAVSASVFVRARRGSRFEPLLLHSGDHHPLPELEDCASAERWSQQAESWLGETELGTGDSEPVPFASAIREGALFALPHLRDMPGLNMLPTDAAAAQDAESDETSTKPGEPSAAPHLDTEAWLGVRFAPGSGTASENLDGLRLKAWRRRQGNAADDWRWFFAMGGSLARQANRLTGALEDRQSGLLNRMGFQGLLEDELERARRNRRNVSLLFINPDGFAALDEGSNDRVERSIQSIATSLLAEIRPNDAACRFGGVTFGVLLRDSDENEARLQADRLRENLRRRLTPSPGEIKTTNCGTHHAPGFTFSCGIATADRRSQPTQGAFEMIRRADESLQAAKRCGGATSVAWAPRSKNDDDAKPFDRLTGIFTGDQAKDYRNMALLWEAIESVSSGLAFDELAEQLVEKIFRVFRARQVALLRPSDPTFRTVSLRQHKRARDLVLLDQPNVPDLLSRAMASRAAETLAANQNEGRFATAIQIAGQRGALAVLYLECRRESPPLETADAMFLRALASQLGVALERALADEQRKRIEARDRRRLEAELDNLKRTLQKARLVYTSPQMEEVVEIARRVAPVDATVLITGASGTGKEVLARSLHDLSPRRDKPMVVVDCGAISANLIESELFGHERGAYTGAESKRPGRLAEAAGGTLFLDEIGELPLAVQSKLLRFVQEHQFTAVGSAKPQRVDVRIVAATNRLLEKEVREGRFREDLFYRLNVVRLHVPDLKDRSGDVMALAEHFLRSFTHRYDKPIIGFSASGLAALHLHDWPGNVRELQNRILQAVILCEGDQVGAGDLDLAGVRHDPSSQQTVGPTDQPFSSRQRHDVRPEPALPRAIDDPRSPEGLRQRRAREAHADASALSRLHHALARQIARCDGEEEQPLGKWLQEDLLFEARSVAHGVNRRAAELVGLPETTFRRKMKSLGERERPQDWNEVRRLLAEVIENHDRADALVERVERVLVEGIVEHHPHRTAVGAALLGVSAPTFRNRLAKYGVSAPS